MSTLQVGSSCRMRWVHRAPAASPRAAEDHRDTMRHRRRTCWGHHDSKSAPEIRCEAPGDLGQGQERRQKVARSCHPEPLAREPRLCRKDLSMRRALRGRFVEMTPTASVRNSTSEELPLERMAVVVRDQPQERLAARPLVTPTLPDCRPRRRGEHASSSARTVPPGLDLSCVDAHHAAAHARARSRARSMTATTRRGQPGPIAVD